MGKILGLDLGTNSIGWAIINDEKEKILGSGVRIFPEGVENLGESNEQSKNATRRDARQKRRQNFRKKLRKERLAKLLIKQGMFPEIDSIYQGITGKNPKGVHFRKRFQIVIRQVRLPEKMRKFFSIDPYEMRSKAYKGEKLSLHQLGRIFYHFAQRRGYKESLQDSDKDDGVLEEGKPKEGKTGINETKKKIEEYGTLGNYLYHEDSHKKRLRNRYTLRSMYEHEFNNIWENEKEYYPDVMTNELRLKIGGSKRRGGEKDGILFYQRPLRSQKHLIGNCTFESDKPRSQKSIIPFEKFRTLQMLNSIRVGKEPLNEEDREVVIEMFNTRKNLKFGQLRKKLSKPDGNYNYNDKKSLPTNNTIYHFLKIFGKKRWESFSQKEQEDIWHIKHFAKDPEWLEQYAKEKWELDEKSIELLKSFNLKDDYANLSRKAITSILPYLKQGYIYDKAVLLGGLRSAFGANEWDAMPEEKRKRIENEVLDTANETDDKGTSIERIKEFLKAKYLLTERQIDKLYHHSVEEEPEIKEHLPQLNKVLKDLRNPVVKQALVEVRKVVNALIGKYGKPDEIRVELARDLKASKSHRHKIQRIQQEREEENNEVKAILDEHDLPHTRWYIEKFKLYNELEDKFGQAINPYNPEETFCIDDLVNGYVEIEHIIPYSKSLNNSLGNKTLCDRETNDKKGNRIPYQYFQDQPEHWKLIKDNIFDILPYWKARRFISKTNPDADDFIERKLNDTRYISRQAKSYLKHICEKVNVAQGTVTSILRHFWGLDRILGSKYEVNGLQNGEYLAAVDEEDNIIEISNWNEDTFKKDEKRLQKKGKFLQGNVSDGIFYPKKQRTDHRHHAVDALAVACSERSYLQQISKLSGRGYDNRQIKENEQFDMPWNNFWAEANKSIQRILVSHKQTDRVLTKVKKRLYDYQGNPKTDSHGNKLPPAEGLAARGQLHKETVYGKYEGEDGEEYFHVRKFLKGFGSKQSVIDSSAKINKIVDPTIRKLVRKAVKKADHSIDINKSYKVPSGAFFKIDKKTKKRIPQVYLPNRNGNPIPVKKVRIRESIGNAEQLKEGVNQYVNPKKNNHVLIYRNKKGNLDEKVVTFWEAVERKKQGISIIQLPPDGEVIIAVLQENEMFLLNLSDEKIRDKIDTPYFFADYLFRVQTKSSKYYEFRLASDASPGMENKFPPNFHRIQSFGNGKTGWKRFNPIKVYISPIGELQVTER